jgi:adenine-specific DNA-methyltransferase
MQKPISTFINRIITGDCIQVMQEMPSASVDFIATDPPYLVNYHTSDGRGYQNDNPNDTSWLLPTYQELFRVLKPDKFCVSFYGFLKAEAFLAAWRESGFELIGHLVWVKPYAANEKFVRYFHSQAYLLTKGRPRKPKLLLPDVLEWQYTGNVLHPAQNPVMAILPLIMAFSEKGDIVLDPFVGSGTAAVAAQELGRHFIGIELDPTYAATAAERVRREGRAA